MRFNLTGLILLAICAASTSRGQALVASPATVAITLDAGSVTTASQIVNVANTGTATAAFTATPSQAWITVKPATGSIAAKGSADVAFQVDAAGLAPGVHSATVNITVPNRPARVVPVTLTINPGAIEATPNGLVFTVAQGSTATLPFTLNFTNQAPAIIQLEAESADGWLTCNRTQSSSFPDTIAVTANSGLLATGAYGGRIRLTTAAESPSSSLPAVVNVLMVVGPPTSFTVTPAALSFTVPAEPAELTLVSQGPPVGYKVSADQPWIVLSKREGLVPGNGADSLTVRIDTSGLKPGVSTGTIAVAAEGKAGVTVSVSVTVGEPGGTAKGITYFPSRVQFIAEAGQTPPPQLLTVLSQDALQVPVSLSASSAGGWMGIGAASLVAPDSVAVEVSSMNTALPALGEIQLAPTAQGTTSDRVPVGLRAAGPAVYTIPRVADGDYFSTSITLVNLDSVPAVVALRFYRALADGTTQAWTPLMEGGAPVENVQIAVGSSYTWNTRGQGTTGDAGWAEVQCAQRLGGFAIFRQSPPDKAPREAAVPLVSGWQQRVVVPFDNQQPYLVAVALTNASPSEPAVMEAMVRDERGDLLPGVWRRTLPPMGHAAFALPTEFAGTAGKRGTVDLATTGGRLAAVALRFSGDPFTSFEPRTLNSRESGRLTIPQVADGGGYSTSITVVNNDVVTARVALRFARRQSGLTTTSAWVPELENNAPAEVYVRAGAAYTWRTRGTSGSLSQGWAEVITSQNVTGFAIFKQSVAGRADQEAAVPINFGAQARFLLPFDNKGYVTTAALANVSDRESATIDITFRDEQARVIRTETLVLAPRGQDAFALTRYPQLSGVRGTAEFRARTGQVSAMGLRFAGEAFTSFRPQVY